MSYIQGWQTDDTSQSRFSTFIGIVPTDDAKVVDTFAIINKVHACPCILVDGDNAGRGYFDAVKASNPPPRSVVFWPPDWTMESVVTWIAQADEAPMLAALGTALEETFDDAQALTGYLLTKKSYAPTHETVGVTLMANPVCRERATQLLNALSDALRDPANAATPLFTRMDEDCTANMHVFRFSPP